MTRKDKVKIKRTQPNNVRTWDEIINRHRNFQRLRRLLAGDDLLDLLLALLLRDLERCLRFFELVIRRRSRKLGEPARRGIDGERDERRLGGGGVRDRDRDVLLRERVRLRRELAPLLERLDREDRERELRELELELL